MPEDDLHVVVGAGPLGLAVTDELTRDGRRVRLVTRTKKGHVHALVEPMQGDATDPGDARRFCNGAVAVYACAQPAYTRWPTEFPPIQAGLLEGAAAADAVYVSAENLYMYGDVRQPLTEELPFAATGKKGQVRARMAEAVTEAHVAGKLRTTAGRASDFYGPRVLDSAVGERFFAPILAGKNVQSLGDPSTLHAYTYIADFARALVTLGADERAWGRAWHVPSAAPITTEDLAGLAYAAAGTTGRVKAVPALVVRAMGIFVPVMRELPELAYEFEHPFLVDHRRYDATFGGHATPHREAVIATVDWYRRHASGAGR